MYRVVSVGQMPFSEVLHTPSAWRTYRLAMGSKAERRAAREQVAAYHETELAELIEHVATAVDRLRAGEIGVHDVDELIHQYHRAARELWKFCWSNGGGAHVEIVAYTLDQMTSDGETISWWELGRSSRRG